MPNLNIPELARVAEWLEAGGDDNRPDGIKFYMPRVAAHDPTFAGACGATACIAGAVAIWHGIPLVFCRHHTGVEFLANSFKVMRIAGGILGLDVTDAGHLFAPEDYEGDECFGSALEDTQWFTEEHAMEDITPAIAARCVRGLIETGEINWRQAFGE